jgi:outer membrane protein assembly factor BamB
MRTNTWVNSGWLLALISLVAPPAGFILNLLRPAAAIRKLAVALLIVAWSAVWAVKLGFVFVQLDGSGSWPIFSMQRPDAVFDAVEQSRAQQKMSTAEPLAAKAAPEAAAETETPAVDQPSTKVAQPSAPAATAVSWPDFRGPNRDGEYTETPILTKWPEVGLKQLWRQPAGEGYASFVVANGRAYTIEQRRRQEVVIAYQVSTGREVWTNAWDAEFRESMGGDGPRATPTYDDGKIYALGATGEFRCLDATTGKVVWRKNILEENGADNLQWGMAASPLIVGEKVIVLPGGSRGNSVVAYDKLTGKPIWKSLNDRQAYTSPMLVTLAGRRQLLVVSADRMMGLTVENGSLLWDYPWKTDYDINSAQPILVGPNRVFISAGYDHGAALVEITPSGSAYQAKTVWFNKRMKNKFSSSVLYQGYIYGLDEAILACIDANTGELKWKGGRYGYGQLLLASGYLVVTTERGDVVLVKATPESHQEIAQFPAVEGKTWNVPVITGGVLLVRNNAEMAAFQIAP